MSSYLAARSFRVNQAEAEAQAKKKAKETDRWFIKLEAFKLNLLFLASACALAYCH